MNGIHEVGGSIPPGSTIFKILLGLLLVLGAPTAAFADTEAYSKATLTEEGRSVAAVAFNPDGTRIVLALDDASARLKDTAGGEGIAARMGGASPPIPLPSALTAHASQWSTMDYGAERMGPGVRSPDRRVHPAGEQLHAPAFSPDGSRIVIASGDGRARILDVATAREIAVLDGHEAGVTDAAYSPTVR